MVACAGLGIFLGVSGYTFHYAKGTSYLSNDPKSCVNCHIMQEQYDSWQKSSHHALARCNDCHVPHELLPKWFAKMENGFHHSKAFTLQNFHEPIRIKSENSAILQRNCMACHADIVGGLPGFHKERDSRMGCVKCHAQVGHGAN
ncbi:MAG: cytochrome c nitrite reductase small subunit [Elusimicrobia bacterium]|nr:cytochrome c nitrite reductase small subunit [Elusimicrobiota bacterium]